MGTPPGFSSPRSFPRFHEVFPNEDACRAYLYAHRFPSGYVCPYCAATEAIAGPPYRFAKYPTMLRCRVCKRNTHLTANTVMEKSKQSICTWFWAAYLLTSGPPGMSALQLQKDLEVRRYETAFQMLHKLRAGMVRPNRDPIGGAFPVEVDEKWVGGASQGLGRGKHTKTLVVGAVEVRSRKDGTPFGGTDPNLTMGQVQPAAKGAARKGIRRKEGLKSSKGGHGRGVLAGRLRLQVVPNREAVTLSGFVQNMVLLGTHVRTDGWGGYGPLTSMGYRHEALAIRGDQAITDKHLPMIHIVFGNLDAWLLGTHHGVSPKHLQAYLNEFIFRFNRRFWPGAAFDAVLGIGGRVTGPTYAGLYTGAWQHPGSWPAPG
jgi:hypothetical protein